MKKKNTLKAAQKLKIIILVEEIFVFIISSLSARSQLLVTSATNSLCSVYFKE